MSNRTNLIEPLKGKGFNIETCDVSSLTTDI